MITTEQRYRAILRNHLPASAVEWVYNYLDHHKVHFHITRGRRSKYGDYRWPQPRHEFHEMSVNGDLNPYLFLWVFLHEAAHLETHLRHPGVVAHGHEWQAEYARLLALLTPSFPSDVQPLVVRCASRVPLYRPLMRRIEEMLHCYDADYNPESPAVRLDDLPAGSLFRLASHPDRLFESVERRRTRWLCRDISNGRMYTVNGRSEVQKE